MTISIVHIYSNGMVLVFDEKGEQVTSLQGRFADKAETISQVSNEQTNFFFARWKDITIPIPDKASFDRLWEKDE